jgi:hypothetical protein
VKSSNYNWRIAISAVAVLVGSYLGQVLGVGFVFLIPSVVIGGLAAIYLVVKKNAYEKKWVSWLHYSNLVLWIIPFLGVASGAFSLTIAEKKSERNVKPLVFGLIGLGLALLNMYIGMKLRQ